MFVQVLYTDHPLVTSAPTGSGKTVIFELAIVRLLMQSAGTVPNGKIVYGESFLHIFGKKDNQKVQ